MASQFKVNTDLDILVSQLESHLNSNETSIKQGLCISTISSDTHLDDLFLS